MLPGLTFFLCLCLLVTLFSVQTSGTANVHTEILNIFNQAGLTQKSVLQISYIKQPPVSALLLVFPLSCFPCQASDTSRAFQPLLSSWFSLIFLFPHDPKPRLQGKTPPWDPCHTEGCHVWIISDCPTAYHGKRKEKKIRGEKRKKTWRRKGKGRKWRIILIYSVWQMCWGWSLSLYY